MDMMSDFDNMNVMIWTENTNPFERELSNAIEESSVLGDIESNNYPRSEFRGLNCENNEHRSNGTRDYMETFSNDFNIRLSQKMDSLMAMMHSQINRAISSDISDRVIPEIKNIMSLMSLSGNRDIEASLSPNSQENREKNLGLRTKTTKKDSWSTGDLRNTEDLGPYMVTGATDTHRQIPEFLTGRIYSHPNLERQESTHNISLDTILPAPEPEVPQTPQDPLNRLADVLVNLQNKPQSVTIRPVTTTPMTFGGKSGKFELFEDLFQTMIKMQPVMSEQTKINHFLSLLPKGALQTFRNINTINR